MIQLDKDHSLQTSTLGSKIRGLRGPRGDSHSIEGTWQNENGILPTFCRKSAQL